MHSSKIFTSYSIFSVTYTYQNELFRVETHLLLLGLVLSSWSPERVIYCIFVIHFSHFLSVKKIKFYSADFSKISSFWLQITSISYVNQCHIEVSTYLNTMWCQLTTTVCINKKNLHGMCVYVCVLLARERLRYTNPEHPTYPLAIPDLFSFNLFHWSHGKWLLSQVWEFNPIKCFLLYHSTHLCSIVSWYSLKIPNNSFSLCAVFPLLHLLLSEEVMQW